MDPETHVKSLILQGLDHISNCILRFSYSQSITRCDDDILGTGDHIHGAICGDFSVSSYDLLFSAFGIFRCYNKQTKIQRLEKKNMSLPKLLIQAKEMKFKKATTQSAKKVSLEVAIWASFN